MNDKYIFKAPKNLSPSHVLSFLGTAEPIFQMKEALISDVLFDLSSVEQTNILGLLLMYKFVEYTSINKCFNNPLLQYSQYVETELKKFGFWKLFQDYMNNKDVNYKSFNISSHENFFIAPLALLRNEKYNDEIIKKNFLGKIEQCYKNNDKAISMILTCIGEVVLNFWEHAVDDTQSIIVASGNQMKVEIACADTGNGIISTLYPVLNINRTVDSCREIVIEKALQRGVTSKKMTNHMGCGLWILNEIVRLAQGRMHLYSEGAYVFNDYGKMKKGRCSFWGGTIIYLYLPLNSAKSLSDIDILLHDVDLNNLKINFS